MVLFDIKKILIQIFLQVMKSINEDELEIAVRLLLRIFQLEPRNLTLFDLPDIPPNELRHNPIFIRHVKVKNYEPCYIFNHFYV